MIWSKPRFQHSIEVYPRVLKEVALPLLFMSFIIWGLEFYVSYINKARFDNPYESTMAPLIIAGVGGVILQCLFSVASLLLVAASTRRQINNSQGIEPTAFAATHFHQTLIETLRGFISVGIYSLFLIIPGLVRWVQLTFTGLVTAFDPAYAEGKKDALKESSRLVRGAWFALFFLLITREIIPMTLQEIAKQEGMGFVAISLLYFVSWLVGLYFSIYIVLTFFARHSLKLERT